MRVANEWATPSWLVLRPISGQTENTADSVAAAVVSTIYIGKYVRTCHTCSVRYMYCPLGYIYPYYAMEFYLWNIGYPVVNYFCGCMEKSVSTRTR